MQLKEISSIPIRYYEAEKYRHLGGDYLGFWSGSPHLRLGDIKGDGRIGFMQISGNVIQTAYDADGNLLWEYIDPDRSHHDDIRNDSNFPIYDIDGDGVKELVALRRINGVPHICLIAAPTGELKKSIPFEFLDKRSIADYRGCILIGFLDGLAEPPSIVFSWDYTHIIVYDKDLKLRWHKFIGLYGQKEFEWWGRFNPWILCDVFTGHGHTPLIHDLNGDGKQEILGGATLLDRNGKVIWHRWKEILEKHNDWTNTHIDGIAIDDINGDGELEVFYSNGAIMCRAKDGGILWSHNKRLIHGQGVVVAKTAHNGGGTYLFVYDDNYRPWKGIGVTVPHLQYLKEHQVRNHTWVFDSEGRIEALLKTGIPRKGDLDGDGFDELVRFSTEGDITKMIISKELDEEAACIELSPEQKPFSYVMVWDIAGDARPEIIFISQDTRNKKAWIKIWQDVDPPVLRNQVPQVSSREGSQRLANWSNYNCEGPPPATR